MDRFIDDTTAILNDFSANLKSNMDRFIGVRADNKWANSKI